MTASANSGGDGAVLVVIPAGRASLETLVGTVDAALVSPVADLRVRVVLSPGDARREGLGVLTAADPRVELAAAGEPEPKAEIVIELPAKARPDVRTLPALVGRIRSAGLGLVAVRVPGLGNGTLRVTARGSGSERLRARDVGLRSAGSRRPAAPPPETTLAAERAEHLRHRARGATMRARMDRNAHRYARERLQVRHERARLRLAEERYGRTGPGAWIGWRTRSVTRRLAGAPAAALALVRSARAYGRRTRRYALDRWRSRGPEPG